MAASRPILLFVPLLFLTITQAAKRPLHPGRCSRFPMDTIRNPRMGDNNFEIRVTPRRSYRTIERFVPGKTYSVVLKNRLPAVSFINFYLKVEVEKMKMKDSMKLLKPGSDMGRGRLAIVGRPARAMFMPNCSGLVTAARQNLQMVKLTWTAPTLPQGCVRFLATVIKYTGHYFKDEGKLNVRICPTYMYANDEENREQMLSDGPPSIPHCCACGTATYKMEFQGKWIRQLHPRNWPEPGELVHWTSIIGASHDQQYSIYQVGREASIAVKEVCERGDTTTMEGNFKEGADRILNIIKTRGINGAKHMSETRTAIFSVNRTHHLMSMLTMLGPSPDWCTGLSSMNLCLTNCEWIKERKINLYPWDAGIMRGNTYQAGILREMSPRRIRNITKDWPPGNPFQTENGRLRPVATVTITRLSPKKNYECVRKALSGVTVVRAEQNDGEDPYSRPGKSQKKMDRVKSLAPNLQAMIPTMCFLTPWTKWSPCSVTCGVGSHTRTRKIKRNLKPALCTYVRLLDKRTCSGQRRTCDYSKPCSVSSWSKWSPCNATCDNTGHSMRTRFLIRRKEMEACKGQVKLEESRNCSSRCDYTIMCSDAVVAGHSCYAPKTMYFYDMRRKSCLPFEYLGCKGSQNRFSSLRECQKLCRHAFDHMPVWQSQRLARKQRMESMKARLQKRGKNLQSCKMAKDEGHKCRRRKSRNLGTSYRWYFSKQNSTCKQMVFKGCSGNENNFLTEQDCKLTCAKLLAATSRRYAGPPQDCKVGAWGPWSACSSKCVGQRMRSRAILRAPLNGGRGCPRIYSYEKCSSKGCKPCRYSSWSPWSACTVTCGSGWQERTREQVDIETGCQAQIPGFVERAVCTRSPCPKRKSFYVN